MHGRYGVYFRSRIKNRLNKKSLKFSKPYAKFNDYIEEPSFKGV